MGARASFQMSRSSRVPCDILIPAARPDVLRADNVERLNCKLVVQGANIPATPEAERYMFERGVVSVPDFIANAGGVICAAVEYAAAARRRPPSPRSRKRSAATPG